MRNKASLIPILLLLPVIVLLSVRMALVKAAGSEPVEGSIDLTITDKETGKPTPVRMRLTRNGQPVKVPAESCVPIMYGFWDRANGYEALLEGSFYTAGTLKMNLPPGKYELYITKGYEYLEQRQVLTVTAGQKLKKTFALSRWINTPKMGWYSCDDHIHMRRSPREDPLLLTWTQAEDIHVGVMLQMGDFWQTYYSQHAWGEKGVYQRNNYMITAGQEDPRTPELGHVVGMAAPEMVRYPEEYYLYDKVFDRLHQLGGIGGYAHQGVLHNGDRGLALDGLRNKVDVMEILQFCATAEPLITDHYYAMLDLGIPLTAVAGSDFPYCGSDHGNGLAQVGSSKIGNARFYTYIDKGLGYNNWKESLVAGHTFVSTGPVIDFKVNNAIPGDHLDVKAGTNLTITANAFGHASQVPLIKLEIVAHGKVIAQVTPGVNGQTMDKLSVKLNIPADKGIWIAARTYGKAQQAAHTTPVYITVNGKGFYNPLTAQGYLDEAEKALKEIEEEMKAINPDVEHQAWKYREKLQHRIDETREAIKKLKENYHLN